MSAKGRLSRYEPPPLDHYATPAWCTRALLRAMEGTGWSAGPVYDPFAGDGAILRVVREMWPDARRGACEIRLSERAGLAKVAHDVSTADFFEVAHPVGHRIVTNPPYSVAQRSIEHCLRLSGSVAALLRLGFLSSRRRNDLLRSQAPQRVLVLPRRPSFRGGGTDSADYAWLVWDGATAAGSTRLEVLPMAWCAGR